MDSHLRRETSTRILESFRQGQSTTAHEPEVPSSRPLATSLVLLAATVAGGLAIRFVSPRLTLGNDEIWWVDTLGANALLDRLYHPALVALVWPSPISGNYIVDSVA